MQNLSVKQKIVSLAFNEPTYEKIRSANFRRRNKADLQNHCLNSLEAPLDTTPAIPARPVIANETLDSIFDVKVNESMEQRYDAGEQIAGYEIEISYNAEIFGKFCLLNLNEEQRAMAIDLIKKDPNYNSILNHMAQKLYKFYLKVTLLANNQAGESKTEYAEVSFSNSKLLKFKISKIENKKNIKKIVCYHALKVMFPEVFELASEFIAQSLGKPKAVATKNQAEFYAKGAKPIDNTPATKTHSLPNETEVEANRLAEIQRLKSDFLCSFEVSLDIILFQRDVQSNHDSFMNSTGFEPYKETSADPIQALHEYFKAKYLGCLFEFQKNQLTDGQTELSAVVHSDLGKMFALMTAIVKSQDRHIVDAFLVKFAKKLAKHLRIDVV